MSSKNINNPLDFLIGNEADNETASDLSPEQTKQIELLISKLTKNDIQTHIAEHISDRLAQQVNEKLPELVQANIDKLHLMPRKVIVQRTKTKSVDVGIQHELFPLLNQYMNAGVNTQLVGPAGSGKSLAAYYSAQGLDIPFYPISCSPEMSKTDIVGAIYANGEYRPSLARQAYEFGGCILWDEFDACEAASIVINGMTANETYGFPDKVVKRHPNCFHIAATNTFGTGPDAKYVSRNRLDGATLDRFTVLVWPYDEKFETALCVNKYPGSDEWVSYVQRVRHAVDSLSIEHIVSPRATFSGAALLQAGVARHQVEASCIWKGLAPEEITKVKGNLTLE